MTAGDISFDDAVAGLLRGDFSRLEPLFDVGSPIERWWEEGRFRSQPRALDEALTCACFNGRVSVARFLLGKGVDPAGGNGTGMNAAHWAANRGQLDAVRLLLQHGAPLEAQNMYGGTVLSCAVWSAINEPKPDHPAIIEALIRAGADMASVGNKDTGEPRVDDVLRRYRSRR